MRWFTKPLLLLCCGALAPLAFAPWGWWPALIPVFGGYWLTLKNGSPRQGFWNSWAFGLGFFGTGVSWVYVSIHTYGNASAGLAALLTLFFVAFLALLFIASFGYCFSRFFRTLPLSSISFAALWTLFEWLRSWILTGFPWLLAGYAHTDSPLASLAPVTGVFGLSLVSVLTATLLASLLVDRKSWLKTRLTLLIMPWLIAPALSSSSWTEPFESPLSVSLLQPNITQDIKWKPEQRANTLALLQQLSFSEQPAQLIVWPENAIPMFQHQATSYLDSIDKEAQQNQSTVIAGLPWYQVEGDSYSLHNSLITLGRGTGVYHKQRLVPFGEYVPVQEMLRGLIDFFNLPMSDFKVGSNNQRPLSLISEESQISIAPFICYEVVYPDFAARLARQSEVLLTVSDDSWFGDSIGPWQHLQMARMRAMEHQKPMLRSTMTGLTALIDDQGQISRLAPARQTLRLDGEIQPRSGLTPFARWGSWPTLFICCLLLLTIWILRRIRS